MADDLISRQTVEETINDIRDCISVEGYWAILERLKKLPSVNPQEPKTGHWIWCVGSHKCSNCEEYTCFSHRELLKYCPNCGARMIEGSDTE